MQILSDLSLEDSGVPIYVQLRQHFLRAIAVGNLKPGDQMPTMRQVAVTLKVDLNTVRRGYDSLERQGAVTLVRGRGSFVAQRPAVSEATPALAGPVEAMARHVLATALAAGIDPVALADGIAALAALKEERP